MKIVVNGIDMEVPAGTTVSTLLRIIEESHTPDMIVEINHRFIHAQAYETILLKEGDRIEVIHLAMGG